MLSAVQHQHQQQQQKYQHFVVPEVKNNNDKNFRTTEIIDGEEEQDNFYFIGQHLNTSEMLLQQQQLDEEEEEEEEEEVIYPEYYNTPNNFEVANRAFYATINKFTRQSCPDASKRRSPPYSFLENWHLHSIYSKSQQTLLGITPVRPAVLLSGDDFMFTPPFIQQEEDDEEEECYNMTDEEEMEDEEEQDILDWDQNEEDATEFYHLSPCPDSNGLLYIDEEEEDDEEEQQQNNLYHHSNDNNLLNKQQQFDEHHFISFSDRHHQENIWIENEQHNLNVFNPPLHHHHHQLSIHVHQSNDDLLQENDQEQQQAMIIPNHHIIDIDTDELYTTDSSSSDEQDDDLSSYDISNLYNNPIMARSSSMLSQRSLDEVSISSVISYQSLADIINKNNSNKQTIPPCSSSLTPNIDDVIIIEDVIRPKMLTTNKFNSYGSTIATQVEIEHISTFQTFKNTMETAMNLLRFNLLFNNNNYASHHDGGGNDTIGNDSNVELGTQHNNTTTFTTSNIFIRTFVYILYIWQLLRVCIQSFIKRTITSGMSFFTTTKTTRQEEENERDPLLY